MSVFISCISNTGLQFNQNISFVKWKKWENKCLCKMTSNLNDFKYSKQRGLFYWAVKNDSFSVLLPAHAHQIRQAILTWHLMPAWLQPQWRGSQYKRQSQPHSSRESRMALSSAFSRASMRAMPEARRRARRRLVGRGWRKKQSSTSTPSTSRSSSDTSSRVSRSAWAHSTVPFLVSCRWQIV